MTITEIVHEILRDDYGVAAERITPDAHLVHDFRVADDGDQWQLLAGLEEALGIEIADDLLDGWLGLGPDPAENAGTVGYLIEQVTLMTVVPPAHAG